MKRRIMLFIVVLAIAISSNCQKAVAVGVREHIMLPSSDEQYCMHFDQSGRLWLGTSAGIKSYDGYCVRNEFTRSTVTYPQLFSDIRSLTSDTDNNLWAGTNDGLFRINLATGKIRHFVFPNPNQQIIYKLFTSRQGTVYVGTDNGFSVYNRKTQTFRHYNFETSKAIYPNGKTDKYKGWGVKDFVETKSGDILIGTWKQGLWLYSPKKNVIRGYNQLNNSNSAYALCIDHNDHLWIGTQGYGVQRLEQVYDYKAATLSQVDGYDRSMVVYDVLQQPDGRIRICTGDTIAAQIGPDGALWLALRQGGIDRILNGQSPFTNYSLLGISCLYTDNGMQFLLGYGMAGLALFDTNINQLLLNDKIPGFGAIHSKGLVTKVTAIVRRYNGELWVAAGDNGVFVRHADNTSEVIWQGSRQRPFIKDNVTALYEDPATKTLWVGQRKGIGVLLPNGRGEYLDIKNDSVDLTGYFMVNNIMRDHIGNIWVASASRGIVRISGNPADKRTIRCKRYDAPYSNITACFEDSRHQIWAICSGGLMMLDENKQKFDVANSSFHLANRPVFSINEDRFGCIWLTTDRALVRLDAEGNTISFTEQDGLSCTSFLQNATLRYSDRLYFGTTAGFVAFTPLPSYSNYRNFKSNLVISDILIDGTSVQSLDSTAIARIISSLPAATREISIPASAKTFNIEFSLLNYANQNETKYAYLLNGYDSEWQYVDGSTHSARYQHLPPGKYSFMLKAADSHGHWRNLPYSITVRVAAPWYATWWAYIIYICIIAALAYATWKYINMLQELEASRRFSSIVMSTQIQPLSGDENSTNHDEQQPEDIDKQSLSAKAALAYQKRDAEFIAKATKLVMDNLADAEYNRDSMAADFSMSVSSLYCRMRECTGLSTQNFIQTIRLNASAEILANEPYIRINELAFRVGFNTPKYFSQCFKKKFGVLPGDYMKLKGDKELDEVECLI